MAEEVLPDSQCGFRSGRGCTDMVYCVRQLVEKAREHNTQIFMLFIEHMIPFLAKLFGKSLGSMVSHQLW